MNIFPSLALAILIALCKGQSLRGGGHVNITSTLVNGTSVPTRVQTTIRFANINQGRSNFGNTNEVNSRMSQMAKIPGDEKGHIIGLYEFVFT